MQTLKATHDPQFEVYSAFSFPFPPRLKPFISDNSGSHIGVEVRKSNVFKLAISEAEVDRGRSTFPSRSSM